MKTFIKTRRYWIVLCTGFLCVLSPPTTLGDDAALIVHLLDEEGRAVQGVEVEVTAEPSDAEVFVKTEKNGADGRAIFSGALPNCVKIGASAVVKGSKLVSARRDCVRAREIFLKLPSRVASAAATAYGISRKIDFSPSRII